MNFKDKHYYIAKIKEYLGMTLTAAMFDAVVLGILTLWALT